MLLKLAQLEHDFLSAPQGRIRGRNDLGFSRQVLELFGIVKEPLYNSLNLRNVPHFHGGPVFQEVAGIAFLLPRNGID